MAEQPKSYGETQNRLLHRFIAPMAKTSRRENPFAF